MPYPDADTLRCMQIDPDHFPSETELQRLGLDPDLLAQAWHIDNRWGELTNLLDRLDDEQHAAGQRVVTYCLLDADQYCDVYGIPAAA